MSLVMSNCRGLFGRIAFSPDEGGGGKPAASEAASEAPAEQASAPPASAEQAAAPNWRDTVSDPDLRSVAERFNTPADAVKAVADLRKSLSTAIKLPGKNASAEELQAFHRALGVPEAPTGYKLAAPEDMELSDADKATQETFAKLMHEAGIPASSAEQFFKGYSELAFQAQQAQIEADKKFAEEASESLKREWGDDYVRNLELAKRAANELFADDFENMTKLELKDGRFLLDHPGLIKLFARVGSEMAEGVIGPRLDPGEAASIEQRIDELGRQKMEAYDKGDRMTADRLDKEQATLISKLSGSGPLVGSQGRAY